jgi:hypothetical protein
MVSARYKHNSCGGIMEYSIVARSARSWNSRSGLMPPESLNLAQFVSPAPKRSRGPRKLWTEAVRARHHQTDESRIVMWRK